MESLIALHRYWIYANRMRLAFLDALRGSSSKKLVEERGAVGPIWILLTDVGIFMAYWYSSLYVVIEGYRELELHDDAIDELLESPNVDFLRLFRNGTLHYQ